MPKSYNTGKIEQKLDDLSEDIQELKGIIKEQYVLCDGRFCRVEKDVANNNVAIAKIFAVAGFIGSIAGVVTGIILKLVWR